MLRVEGLHKPRSVAHKFVLSALLIACLGGSNVAAEDSPLPIQTELHIRIIDSNGDPVKGAAVEVLGVDGKVLQHGESNIQGLVSLEMTSTPGTRLRIQHPEFEERLEEIRLFSKDVREVTLKPRKLQQTLTVTATRTSHPIENLPVPVNVISRSEIKSQASVTLDDALRQLPAFSLFRRTSSLVAHPTTQGVSLRGIGPSGVSRTLVLLDGIPLNDPFGGWVYWSQLDKTSLDQIEISPGGGSSLYGSSALGGVIQIVSREPESNHVEIDIHGGSKATAGGDLLASGVKGPWSGNVAGSFLHTDGYYIVAPENRGLVDDRAGSVHYMIRAGGFYKPSVQNSLFLYGTHFSEDRDNGTALQKNETDITSARLGYRHEGSNGEEWQLRGYAATESFFSNFTAINATRSVEILTLNQRVPARSAGTSVQWTKLFFSRHLVTTGIDWQWVHGNSEEFNFAASRFQVTGGSQQLGGMFLQDVFTPSSRWLIQLGARVDGWSNYDAQRRDLSFITGARTTTSFVTQHRGTLNPKAGISFQANEQLTLRGSYYHSFRAPTLNELYRGFRVGNVLTNPNDLLGPESLDGVEGGFDWQWGPRFRTRVTAFWNQLENAVSNVTVSSSPNLITRRRQNVGEIRVKGLETDTVLRLWHYWSLRLSYLWNDAVVTDFPPNLALTGKQVPQVPHHRASASLSYSHPRLLEGFASFRFVGSQYDDDLNMFALGNFPVFDVQVSRMVNRSFSLFASAENLLNRRYAVARTPLENIGTPRLVHAGIRLQF